MIGPVYFVASREGRLALAVPVAPCSWCGTALPIDHGCRTVRELFQLTGNTLDPAHGLEAIQTRTEGRPE
ncbi:hypothetical protein GCM10023196_036040 [Actinoallomurus vinaceus]|uniref:Uncharacterized protein n=1 Tax=Actinoallomurus vinaceus TaxID=1080074 RepID=A0ABP8UAS5_9ACTN